MNKWIVLWVATACVAVIGCHGAHPGGNPPPQVYPGAAPVPFPGGAPVVPGGAPVMPPPGSQLPPGSVVPAPVPMPGAEPVVPPQQSKLGPGASEVPESPWEAPKKEIHLGNPEPASPGAGGDKLPATPPAGQDPLLNTPPAKPAPAASESALPSGIAQFAVALPGVTSGLRPMLDGLDWLKSKGYKTVLHIKRPGQDDAADRKQVEKRGLTYLALDVSPETLNAKVVEEFTRIVSDKSSYPLFIYDKDGSLAGGLWYLYFRQTEESVDLALIRAGSLGLRTTGDGPHAEMWLAIQKYLAEKSP